VAPDVLACLHLDVESVGPPDPVEVVGQAVRTRECLDRVEGLAEFSLLNRAWIRS